MITLFHAGYEEIRDPDVHKGRTNADFGQGFYTSDNKEFASRWARPRKGETIILNEYKLDDSALSIKRLKRDEEWFEFIYNNRRNNDTMPQFDLIIGPIANDTIYDTLGITTSGFLSKEESMKILQVGNIYDQIVLKSKRASDALTFVGSQVLSDEAAAANMAIVKKEQDKYQEEIANIMKGFE
jgi:hypothetical protein